MSFKNLSQLRTLVRQKADIENDGNHVTDAEIDTYINSGIETLYSLLVDGTDGTLFAKNAGVLHKLGDNTYQLPSDFGQLISVDIFIGHTYIRSVQADPQDQAQLATQNYNGVAYTRHFLKWNVDQGRGELWVYPAPTNTVDLSAQYIPEPPSLSLDTDTLNFPTFWYQWVVYDAAIACSIKEESDPSALMSERQRIEVRVRDHIRSMTPTRVKTIRNVSRWDERNSRFALPTVNYRSGG